MILNSYYSEFADRNRALVRHKSKKASTPEGAAAAAARTQSLLLRATLLSLNETLDPRSDPLEAAGGEGFPGWAAGVMEEFADKGQVLHRKTN